MTFDKGLLGGSTRFLVLSLLNEGDRYGYEIIRTLAERSEQAFAFQEGTLYPILHKMEHAGWVRAYEKTADGRKRRYYAITDKGKKQLADEREQWQAFSGAVTRVIEGGAHAFA